VLKILVRRHDRDTETLVRSSEIAVTAIAGRQWNHGSRWPRFIDWVGRHHDTISRYTIATAVVVGTAMERGFITAATWVVDTPCPVRVFGDPVDAEKWLRQMAEKH
jgi:hypothetical protein